jgi:hypothetical protein
LPTENPANGGPDAGSEPKRLAVHPWSRRHGCRRCRSDGAEVVRRGFACLAIGYNFVRDLLSLVEAVHPGAFDGADVNENILTAVIRLDEAKSFLAVEPLHGSLRHETLLSVMCFARLSSRAARFIARDLGEVRQSDAQRAARPSRSAETRFSTHSASAKVPQGRCKPVGRDLLGNEIKSGYLGAGFSYLSIGNRI